MSFFRVILRFLSFLVLIHLITAVDIDNGRVDIFGVDTQDTRRGLFVLVELGIVMRLDTLLVFDGVLIIDNAYFPFANR